MRTLKICASLLVIAVVAFSLSSLQSCEKNEPIPSNPAQQEQPSSGADFLNQNGDYAYLEDYGILHNGALDYLSNQSNFTSLGATAILGHTFDYLSSQTPGSEVSIEDMHPELLGPDDDFVNSADQLGFSSAGMTKAAELQDHLLTFTSTPNLTAATANATLLNFEDGVENSSLSHEEKFALLGTSVIARYSVNYWAAASADENSPWHLVVSNDADWMTSSNHLPTFIKGHVEEYEETPSLRIPWRAIIDAVAYFRSLDETEGGMFDDDFRGQVARNDAAFYSNLMSL